MDLNKWISENTRDTSCVVEFGSQFFDKLSYAQSIKKIGIEIWKPFIISSTYHDCIKINGDFTKYRDYVQPHDFDCAMMIDAIEHINKEAAVSLINEMKVDFNKILVCTPEGVHKQYLDPNNMGADEYQTHRSTWYKEDFEMLGFQDIQIDPIFHNWVKLWGAFPENNTGGIFATWTK